MIGFAITCLSCAHVMSSSLLLSCAAGWLLVHSSCAHCGLYLDGATPGALCQVQLTDGGACMHPECCHGVCSLLICRVVALSRHVGMDHIGCSCTPYRPRPERCLEFLQPRVFDKCAATHTTVCGVRLLVMRLAFSFSRQYSRSPSRVTVLYRRTIHMSGWCPGSCAVSALFKHFFGTRVKCSAAIGCFHCKTALVVDMPARQQNLTDDVVVAWSKQSIISKVLLEIYQER